MESDSPNWTVKRNIGFSVRKTSKPALKSQILIFACKYLILYHTAGALLLYSSSSIPFISTTNILAYLPFLVIDFISESCDS